MPRYIQQAMNQKTTLLYDDRERAPWRFLEAHWPMEKTRLKTGDYTLVGWEDRIAIEKKSGWAEIIGNVSKPDRARFRRFLKRLSAYDAKVLVVEEPLTVLAVEAAVKKARASSNGKSCATARQVYWWVCEIQGLYGVPLLAVDKGSLRHVLPGLIEGMWRRVRGM